MTGNRITKVLKGKIEQFLITGSASPTKASISIELPSSRYQKYFPDVKFHQNEGSRGKYWGDCDVAWLKEKLGKELGECQRFQVRLMSDETLRYRLVPFKKLTDGDYKRIDEKLDRLLPSKIL